MKMFSVFPIWLFLIAIPFIAGNMIIFTCSSVYKNFSAAEVRLHAAACFLEGSVIDQMPYLTRETSKSENNKNGGVPWIKKQLLYTFIRL